MAWSGTLGKFLTTGLVIVLMTPGARAQSPAVRATECGVFRNGWSLKPSADGELGQLYWANQGYTESWMTLRPSSSASGGRRNPGIRMVLSVCFEGRIVPTPLRTVQVRFQWDPGVFIADGKLVPELYLTLNNDRRLALAGPGLKSWLDYSPNCGTGDGCSYSAVIVDVPISELETLSRAHSITGLLSGVAFELSASQIQALSTFKAFVTGAGARQIVTANPCPRAPHKTQYAAVWISSGSRQRAEMIRESVRAAVGFSRACSACPIQLLRPADITSVSAGAKT